MLSCRLSSDVTFVDREDQMTALTKGFYSMTDNIGMFGKIGCQLAGYGCRFSTRLIGLTSPPGYGKSELACYYSRQYEGKDTWALYKEMDGSSSFEDLIRYLLLPLYADSDKAAYLEKVRNFTLQEFEELFVSVIVRQPADVLVFIDNCDAILFDKKEQFMAKVKSFVSRVPNLRILVTSRERRLKIKKIEVPPLPTPAAVQLLQEGTNMSTPVALQVCGLTGNLPAALVLVRPLVEEYYSSDIPKLLKDLQKSRLGPMCYKDPNYNVCAAFNLSYSHLSKKCQHIGQLYSYFPGAFSKVDGHRILSYVVDSSDIAECEKILMSISLMTPQTDFQIALEEGRKYPIFVREYFHEKLLTKPSLLEDVAGYFCLVYSENLALLSKTFESDPAGSMMKLLADQHNYRHMLNLINQHQISADTDIFRSLLNNMASLSRSGVGVLFSNEDLGSVHKEIITVALNASTFDDELRQMVHSLLSNWKYFEANLPQKLANLQQYYPELEHEVYAEFLEKMSSGPFPFRIVNDSKWTLQYNSSTGARFYCYSTIWISCYQSMLDFMYWIGENETLKYLQRNYAAVTQKLNACSTTQCYEALRQEYKKDKFTVFLIEQTFKYYTSSKSVVASNIMLLFDRFIYNHKYWDHYHQKAVLREGKEKVLWEELQSSLTSLHEQDVFDEVSVRHTVKLMKHIIDLNRNQKDDGDDDGSTSTSPDEGSNVQDPLQQDNGYQENTNINSETVVNQFRDYLANTHNPHVTESSFHWDMSAFHMKAGLPDEVISMEDRKLAQEKLRDTCFAYEQVNVHTPPPNSSFTNSFWYRFICYKQFCTFLGSDAMTTKQQEYTMYSMLLGSTNQVSINQKVLEYHRNMSEQEPFSYVQALFTAAKLHFSTGKSQTYCSEARRVIISHQVNPQWNRTLLARLLMNSVYCRMQSSDNNLFLLLWDILNAGQLTLLDQYSLNTLPPPPTDSYTDPSKITYEEVKYVMKNDVTEERVTEYLQRHGIACSSEPLMSVVPQYRWVMVLKDFLIYAAIKMYYLIISVALLFVALMLFCNPR